MEIEENQELLRSFPIPSLPKVYLVVLYHHEMASHGDRKVLLDVFSSREKAREWLKSEGYTLQTDLKWGKKEQDPFQVWSYVLIKEYSVK